MIRIIAILCKLASPADCHEALVTTTDLSGGARARHAESLPGRHAAACRVHARLPAIFAGRLALRAGTGGKEGADLMMHLLLEIWLAPQLAFGIWLCAAALFSNEEEEFAR